LSFTARPYKFIPTENILFDLSGNILFYFFFGTIKSCICISFDPPDPRLSVNQFSLESDSLGRTRLVFVFADGLDPRVLSLHFFFRFIRESYYCIYWLRKSRVLSNVVKLNNQKHDIMASVVLIVRIVEKHACSQSEYSRTLVKNNERFNYRGMGWCGGGSLWWCRSRDAFEHE
jgi:hypothetical protein